MPRKNIFSKRKSRRIIPFNIMDILYLTGSTNLFRNPYEEPGNLEIETLHEHGITLDDFKKNRRKFEAAYKKAEKCEMEYWCLQR